MITDRDGSPLISIIVPVYNAESFLPDCIESLLSQTLNSFEVLLINDGSQDRSLEICKQYAVSDNRIRVFNKENGGVSSARNVGLQNVKGKWLTFVDADDILKPNALLYLSSLVEINGTELGISGYECFNEQMAVVSTTADAREAEIVSKEKGITLLYENRFWQWFICSKIFNSAIIKQQDIKFDERIYFGEDRLFIMKYVCAMQGEICFSSMPVYRYRIHKRSVEGMASSHFNERTFTGFMASAMMYAELCKSNTMLYNKYLGLVDIVSSYKTLKKTIKKLTANNEQKELLSKLTILLHKSVPLYKYYIILILRFLQAKVPSVDANIRKILTQY